MLQKTSLKLKLIGGFVIVGLITLGVGMAGWMGIANYQNVSDEIVELANTNVELLQREIDHLNWARRVGQFQRDENMTTLEVEKDPHKCGFGAWYYSDKRKEAEVNIPDIAAALKAIETPHAKLHNAAMELEKLLKQGKEFRSQAIALYQNEIGAHLREVQKILQEVSVKVNKHLHEKEDIAQSRAGRIKAIALAGMMGGFALALALGIYLCLSITRPVQRIITGLGEGAEQVTAASGQVAGASQQLAEGSSEQAAALEETSSSLEEMASMTKANADNANQANSLMADAGRVVERANQSMAGMTNSMKEISAASDETAKIIKTIDEIAFQTNLLALNAAVEAARAGEAGAGFAVVADEVRNLAMRAAEAAKNTATLIEGTVTKVKDGSELVHKTAEDFTEVAASTTRVKDLVAEIAAASNEQAQGVDQISRAINEMDKVVQANAANAEESASASEELSAQAEQMKGVVGELVALVNGDSGNGRQMGGLQSDRRLPGGRGGRPALPQTGAAGGESRGLSARRALKSGPARVVAPAQVIPFDDEDFKNF